MTDDNEFKWGEEETIIPQVNAVAVYENRHGDAVIRQQSDCGDDSIIIVPALHLRSLIRALEGLE